MSNFWQPQMLYYCYFYCITAICSFAFWLLFVFTVQSQKDSDESGRFLLCELGLYV